MARRQYQRSTPAASPFVGMPHGLPQESDLHRSCDSRILSIHLPPSPKTEKPLPPIPRHPFASTSGIRRSFSLSNPPAGRPQSHARQTPSPSMEVPFPMDPAQSMPELDLGQRNHSRRFFVKPPGSNASRTRLKKRRSDTSIDANGSTESGIASGSGAKSRTRKVSDTLRRLFRPASNSSFRRNSGDLDFACGGSPVDLASDFYNLAAQELATEEAENRRDVPYSAPPETRRYNDFDPFARTPPSMTPYESPATTPYYLPASAIPVVSHYPKLRHDPTSYFPAQPPVPVIRHRSSEASSTDEEDSGVRVSAFPFPAPPRDRPTITTRTGPSTPNMTHRHPRVLSEPSTHQNEPGPPSASTSSRRTHQRSATQATPRSQLPAVDVPVDEHGRMRTRSGRVLRPRPGPPPTGPLPRVPDFY